MSSLARSICALAFCLGASPLANATGPVLPPDLARSVADYDRAQIDGDKAALQRLLANDYRLVNGRGGVETKAEFVAEAGDPTFKLDPFVVTVPIDTVWAGGAVLAGEVYLTGRSAGKPFTAHFRFADVWAKRAGVWQVVFTEVTPL